ncbi:MAG: PQQ-like beta-propeller repeat protein [Planctomycetes bacterium]|nr:PQQ-like beta-propeller repeat protein [Planctomycetota bacterium]
MTADAGEQSRNTSTPQPALARQFWPPVVILLTGGGLLFALQSGRFSVTDRPSSDFHFILWTVEFSLFLWGWFASPFSPIGRLKMLFVLFALQAVGCLLFRINGYEGDGRAIITFRWTPSADELFVAPPLEETPIAARNGIVIDTSPHDVPGYRGEHRDGVLTAPAFDTEWEKSPPHELWRHPVGVGWSSFSTAGEYCFTMEQRGEQEAVVCYEVRTGKQIWEHRDTAYFKETTGGNGPRATPTFHDGRIVSLGATGILNCLDATSGKVHWTRNILSEVQIENRIFGMCGSPLVVGNLVIVFPGGPGASVAAWNFESGEPVWRGGSAESSYSSPQLAEIFGEQVILNFNAEGLYAHSLADGRERWNYPWVSNPDEKNNVCQPVVLPGGDETSAKVFIASGYSKGCAVLEVRRNSPGVFQVEPLWQNRNLKAKFTCVVLKDGFVYGLDERILTCIDVATGERKWKRGRYGHGQLALVCDLLVIQSEPGEVCLVEARPDRFREIARLPALTERTWNHPVISGRYLLVRNDREAACFELQPARDKNP